MTDQESMQQFQNINERLDRMDERMDRMNEHMDRMDERMDRMNEHMDRMDERLDRLAEHMDQMQERMLKGFEALNNKIDGVEQRVTERQSKFEDHMMEEFQKVIDTIDEKFLAADQKLAESVHDVKVYMKLAVGNRVSALFDGYEIEHSHRVALERDTSWLKRQVEDIQTRLSVLERQETA